MKYRILLDKSGHGVEIEAESFKQVEVGLLLQDTNGKLVASFREYVGIVPVIDKEEK